MHELKKILYKFLGEWEDGLTTEQESILLTFVEYAKTEKNRRDLYEAIGPEKPSSGNVVQRMANAVREKHGIAYETAPMPCYSGDAIVHKDGKFHVAVNIQDGTERCGSYEDLRVAQ